MLAYASSGSKRARGMARARARASGYHVQVGLHDWFHAHFMSNLHILGHGV